ncbi:MAG: DMT family transporter [Actinomycetota bacterium]|nr:DMT family transporter [Actinomycetota bacterium]
MAIVFALISAFAYGISDFLGGLFAKRVSAWQVAVVGQSSSAFFALIAGLFIGGDPTRSDWVWAGIAGLGGGFGAAFLYRGLARGRMSVVAPISAIGSALVPVAIGLILGDRPSTLVFLGVLFAFPAIYLISQVVETAPAGNGGILDGVLAGLGFGIMFAMLGQVGSESGLLPLALTQVGAVLGVIITAAILRAAWVPRDPAAYRALMMGPLGIAATGAFLYATHHGLLSVVSVIASLYPAGTVVLASVVLREKIHLNQAIGLMLAMAAVALVAAG